MSYNATSKELSYASSYRASKESILDLATDTSKIYELRARTYVYKERAEAGIQCGYIAEEVHELDTAFAAYNEPDGPPIGINWNGIQIYMMEEMKKLRAEVDALKAQLAPAAQ